MNMNGVLDCGYETVDDFDNAHPSSPFFVPSLPRHLDNLNDEDLYIEALNMGRKAAEQGEGKKANPFDFIAYRELSKAWKEGWREVSLFGNDEEFYH